MRILRKDSKGRALTQRVQVQCLAGRESIFAAHVLIEAFRLPELRGIIQRFEIERRYVTAIVVVPDDIPDVDAWAIELRDALTGAVGRMEWEWRRRGLPWPPEKETSDG